MMIFKRMETMSKKNERGIHELLLNVEGTHGGEEGVLL